MIEKISFNKVTPNIFADSPQKGESSEVWGQELEFKKGSSYLVEAASGRGKSSLCAFIYGLRSDYRGDISMIDKHGNVISIDNEVKCLIRKTAIAIMFQELRLFPELTAVENIMLKNRLTDYYTEHEIREMLSLLGLHEKQDTLCAKMSLGQQQRVAFVRMLSQPTDFFLLDEPVSHLDIENTHLMSKILTERQISDGSAVIVTSIGNRLPYNYTNILKL